MGLVTHLHSYDPSWKMIVLSKILGVLCQSLVLQYQSLLRHFFFFLHFNTPEICGMPI